jgi:protein-tyrosine phosphatase
MQRTHKTMVPDIYWLRDIEPLKLALMPRPRGGEWLAREVAQWKRFGIDVVVSLLHAYEAHELGIAAEESLCGMQRIRFRSFPIQDCGVPESVPAYRALADELAALVQQRTAVAIHCRAGIGRSALLAGSVLLRLGLPPEAIFPAISRARGLAVPDTPAQIEWFRSVGRYELAI